MSGVNPQKICYGISLFFFSGLQQNKMSKQGGRTYKQLQFLPFCKKMGVDGNKIMVLRDTLENSSNCLHLHLYCQHSDQLALHC